MPRALRLFNVVAAGSALLFVVTAAVFMTGRCFQTGARTTVCFQDGDLDVWIDSPRNMPRRVWEPFALTAEDKRWFAGVGYHRVAWTYGPSGPVWPYLPDGARAEAGPGGTVVTRQYTLENIRAASLLVFAVTPIAWFVLRLGRSARHDSRLEGGLCTACGYDLRATLERCPECGAVPRWVTDIARYRRARDNPSSGGAEKTNVDRPD